MKANLEIYLSRGQAYEEGCEPILGRYLRHLTAMDGGNAEIAGMHFSAMA
ncbi:hypothetical protein HORIV_53590 [Vreelandella olivaria]|uniref:Uncharacterized protein n=1 Tax=Vreelandella olivaria TaxID=390919 RepID=A0ABN5X253_9GAMM|nr:hypothetical protein HORIV_53590 [Halomonas olivaria]